MLPLRMPQLPEHWPTAASLSIKAIVPRQSALAASVTAGLVMWCRHEERENKIKDLERQARDAAEGETAMTAQLEVQDAKLDTVSAAYAAQTAELQASQVRSCSCELMQTELLPSDWLQFCCAIEC